jgi:Conjugative transposon protein TcpC
VFHLRRDRDALRRPRRARAARTPAELARAIGRATLWCLVAVLLLRGAGDVLATPEREPLQAAPREAPGVWPDDEARAFAAQFARAYLGYSPRRPDESAREVLAFVSPDLAGSIVPEFSRRDPDASAVQDAIAARAERLDDRRALITVATSTATSTRYLTVPVARDAGGGLVVFDLPSFMAPPAQAQLDAVPPEPLTGADATEVEDVLERFFRAFLAGRTEDLEYLVPAGVRIAALGEPLELVAVESASELEPLRSGTRAVLATVRARDPQSGAAWTLRYRVRLVRGDRWYVAAVNTTRKEG